MILSRLARFMKNHRKSWKIFKKSSKNLRKSLKIMIFDDFLMIFDDFRWFSMIFHDFSWILPIYSRSWLVKIIVIFLFEWSPITTNSYIILGSLILPSTWSCESNLCGRSGRRFWSSCCESTPTHSLLVTDKSLQVNKNSGNC